MSLYIRKCSLRLEMHQRRQHIINIIITIIINTIIIIINTVIVIVSCRLRNPACAFSV